MLFHSLYAPEAGLYCAQLGCTLYGNLQVSTFKQAWQRVVDRHPVLRTAFNWAFRDEPFQVVYRHVALPWRQDDWRGVSAVEQERQLKTFLGEDRAQGFELSKAPLMRLSLVQLAEDAYQIVWSLHHLLLDGWSLHLLLQEVFQIYTACCVGQELNLQARRPYADYIAWLRQQDLSQAEAFWRQTLKGFTTPTVTDFGRDHESSSGKEQGYAEQQMRLSAAATTALQAVARQHHLSVNTLVQGAWAVLLSRYSRQEDVVFGATVAGRPTELVGVESMIGLFINTLPVRVRVGPEALLFPWLQELQREQVEARQYEYSPLVQVQGWSEVPRGLPLFESLLVFENYPAHTAIPEWCNSLEIHHMRFMSSTNYPLTVVAVPGRELGIRIGYQCHRFDDGAISRMLGHLRTLLEGMIANRAQRLADLPTLTAAERHQLVVEWNDTSAADPQTSCIHQLFEAQVARTPDAVAVVFEDQVLTYRELNIRANKLAHHLQALGVGPEILVGICVERSLEIVVGLLAIIKAGGAYVPLDPAYPQERLTFILQDAQISMLLTRERLIARLIGDQTKVVCLDLDRELIAQEGDTNPVNKGTPDNLVYVIYTSGSTGAPKGVAVEHRQLCNYLHGVLRRLALPSPASFATVSTIATDLGNTMIFSSLCTGGCLHVLSEERVADPHAAADYFTHHSIDCLKIVPSHLAALHTSSHPEQILPRELLILGGEASRSDWVKSLKTLAPGCTILNHYGPTEATVGVLTYRVGENQRVPGLSTLPLGRPLSNVRIYLLDQHLQPVPIGVQGELYIGGANLARGYLNRPALTAEKFIPDPFSDQPGTRLYKTGDLARYLPDGNIEFLGRLDNQAKTRGYRIELGEIEATLERHPAVRRAVVLAREDTSGDRRLVAYCVAHNGLRPDIRELRSFLQTKLPDYMVPAAFLVLDALPRTPNGKIDRHALPAPDQTQPSLLEAFVAPRTPIEELLADIWASVLKVESIGIHDNFFDLGGHSLLAVQVISRLRRLFQVDVPLRVLFDAPTVASLARRVEEYRQAEKGTPTLPVLAEILEGAVPLTMIQEHLWELDRLVPGAPFSNMPYAARLTGPLNVTALEQSFNTIIQRHETLRTTFTTSAGQPVQVIAPTLHVPLEIDDLRTLPEAARQAAAHQLIRAEVLYPFDLEKGPLVQARLLRLGEQEHILLLTMHHIISDGWSWGVFLHELAVFYEAFSRRQPSPLPELPIQYRHYAHWQHRWLRSGAGKAQLAYWMEQLEPPLPLLDLPTKPPPVAKLSLHTARQRFQISKELMVALTRLSRQEGATLFITLVAALKTLLYGYTGQEDIRVATLVANRQHQHTERLIGLLANLAILRTRLDGNPSLREILRRVRTTTLDAYTHQDLPFEYLARALVHVRQSNRRSLFQVMFALQNARQQTLALPGLAIQVLETQPLEASTCELAMSIRETSQGLEGLCLYQTARFDPPIITRLLDDYNQVIECLASQPELRLATFRARQEGESSSVCLSPELDR
ncbi:MAG TPA: amino acid adenylation domain-containing protein [Candidatus Tectomicrobia bacterium]|nr:amino acid adenylation domain-containing protein [Candidatus Tectomicrobia bacterium]